MNALLIMGAAWYIIGFCTFAIELRGDVFDKNSLPYLFWGSFLGPLITVVSILDKMDRNDALDDTEI